MSNILDKWLLNKNGDQDSPTPEDESPLHLRTVLVKDKIDKSGSDYLHLYCMAHCVKVCFKEGFLMSPNSYTSLFQYGPLLKSFLKLYIKDEQIMLSRE